MALEPLVAAITGSGTVTADLSDLDPNLRLTSEYIQVLQDGDPKLRLTSEYIQVLYLPIIEPLAAAVTASGTLAGFLGRRRPLVAAITGSGIVTADLRVDALSATIFAQVYVTGNLTGTWQFSSGIIASGTITALLGKRATFSTSITGSGTLYGDLAFRINAGNTLDLDQTATVETILNITASSTVVFTDEADAQIDIIQAASNIINFTDDAGWAKVLPTETASSNLVLSQLVEGFRAAESFLVLTQEAVVFKNVTDEEVTSELNLTQSASFDTILNLSASSTLVFNQIAVGVWWGIWTASNTLTFNQEAVGTLLDIGNFVLLQAPWGMIQTTIVLPAPEWGDTEGLTSDLTLRRSMNGKTFTYVKSNANRIIKYLFLLPRMKALELEQFLKSYNSSEIKMMNWKGEVWRVNLLTNPIEFEVNARYDPTSDRTDVNLEFEGVKISG